MAGKSAKIEVGIQQPRVVKQLKKAGGHTPKAFCDMVAKVQKLDLAELAHASGLNWEKLEGKTDKKGRQLWSLRINDNWRALCVLLSGPVIEIVGVFEHDKAYR